MYKTERITDDSYNDIQFLYLECFKMLRSHDFIKTKYYTKSFGLRNVGVLAKSDTAELAGFYGVFPIILNYENKDILVAQSGDTMTSPNHRKKGLFIKLAKETYELAESLDVKLVFGFPNKFSFPGFKKKLNWSFYGCMQTYVIEVFTLPICEIVSKISKLKPLYDKFIAYNLKKYLVPIEKINYELFNQTKVKGLIKKNETFFRYKLQKNNVYVIEMDGVQVLMKVDDHLIVGEIGATKEVGSGKVIYVVKKLAKKLGCKKVIFNLSPNHWLSEVLSGELSAKEGLPIGFYSMSDDIDCQDIQFSNADFDTF
ncbi:MAG: GNAT family N-acetyltransferase [Flavobacteriales bacterium]